MDELNGVEQSPRPPARRRRRGFVLSIAAALLLIIGLGTAAAFAVPIVSVTPDKPLAQLLPETTALYVSADLNPTGSTSDNLQHIENAFTSQPGWKNISKQYDQVTRPGSSSSACYQQTQGQVASHLGDLGHDSVFALIGTQGLTQGSSGNLTTAAEGNIVFLASLDVHESLVDALSGFHLSLQQTTIAYQGTTIYEETLPACAKTVGSAPGKVYAALVHGYIVLGFLPGPIERVIDTASGAIPNLTADATYQGLESRMPGGQLGGYYVSGKALHAMAAPALKSTSVSESVLLSQALQSSAAGLYADPGGFRLDVVSPRSKPTASATGAGEFATTLRADTLVFFSLAGASSAIKNAEQQLKKLGALKGSAATLAGPIVNDLTTDVAGEIDLALLRPNGTLSFTAQTGSPNLPAVLAWKVSNDFMASAHLDDLVRRLGGSKSFTAATAPDGTHYRLTKQGYGYAVRDGWAIASASIVRVLGELSSTSLSSLASVPAYQAGLPPDARASSIFYLDAAGLRSQLEAAILPKVSASEQQQYRMYAQPVLAPISSISFSAGTTNDGKESVSRFVIGIK